MEEICVTMFLCSIFIGGFIIGAAFIIKDK